MNILITGATGLIGYHLVKSLLKNENATIYAAGRSMHKLEDTFSEYTNNPQLRLCEYAPTIGNLDMLGNLDYIFHLAGPTSPDDIDNRPIDVIRPNVIDLSNIFDYAVREKENGKKCRVIVSSSVTIYQNSTDKDISLKEADTLCTTEAGNPLLCYSESKRYAELVAKSYEKQYGIDVVMVRIGYVYGFTKNIPNTTLYNFMQSAIKGEKIEIHNASLPRRDNIYIDDVIHGLEVVAKHAKTGEVVNISSNGEKGNFASLDEMASIICNVLYPDSEGKKNHLLIPEISNRKPGICANNACLSKYGWNIEYSLSEGIKQTIKDLMHE